MQGRGKHKFKLLALTQNSVHLQRWEGESDQVYFNTFTFIFNHGKLTGLVLRFSSSTDHSKSFTVEPHSPIYHSKISTHRYRAGQDPQVCVPGARWHVIGVMSQFPALFLRSIIKNKMVRIERIILCTIFIIWNNDVTETDFQFT